MNIDKEGKIEKMSLGLSLLFYELICAALVDQ